MDSNYMRPGWRVGPIVLLALGLIAGTSGCRSAVRPAKALLYVDLDGTLLDDDGRVPEQNAAALARFQAAGGRVGIATGRMPERGLPYAEAVSADLPSILANGAVILAPTGEPLAVHAIMGAADVTAMCAEILRAGCREIYCAHGDPATGQVRVELGACRPPPEPGWGTIKLRAKVCAAHARLLAELPAMTGGRYEIIEAGTGDELGVSVGSLAATKGRALAFVAARLGLDLSQVAYVGDSGNDVSAAEAVTAAGGRCFAVNKAVAALEAVCPEHLDVTNAQGAVARVVQILLGGQ